MPSEFPGLEGRGPLEPSFEQEFTILGGEGQTTQDLTKVTSKSLEFLVSVLQQGESRTLEGRIVTPGKQPSIDFPMPHEQPSQFSQEEEWRMVDAIFQTTIKKQFEREGVSVVRLSARELKRESPDRHLNSSYIFVKTQEGLVEAFRQVGKYEPRDWDRGQYKDVFMLEDVHGSKEKMVRARVRSQKDKPNLAGAIAATKVEEFRRCDHLMPGHYYTWQSEKSGEQREGFITPYMSGPDLKEIIFSGKKGVMLPKRMVLQGVLEVARGLKVMHDLNWIHRDIKPGNIFCKVEWEGGIPVRLVVKLADFDFAREVKSEEDLGNPGSRITASPELFTRGSITSLEAGKAVDVYAMGVVLWTVLHGKEATWNDNLSTSPEEQRRAHMQQGGLVEGEEGSIDALCYDACEPNNPSARPTIDEFIERLERALENYVEEPQALADKQEQHPTEILGLGTDTDWNGGDEDDTVFLV